MRGVRGLSLAILIAGLAALGSGLSGRDAAGVSWFPGTGTWFAIRRRHLVVGRGRRTLWRSHEEIAASRLGVIAAGPVVGLPCDGRSEPATCALPARSWTGSSGGSLLVPRASGGVIG
jgi:hypothetical protein